MIPVFIPPVIIQAPLKREIPLFIVKMTEFLEKHQTIAVPVVLATLRRPCRNALNSFGFIL